MDRPRIERTGKIRSVGAVPAIERWSVIPRQVNAMSRALRQQAIKAELARRDAAGGVPPHLHVYTVRPHYGDEGGPRPYLPVQWIERARAAREGREEPNDLDLVRRSVDRALRSGEPVELAPSEDERYSPDAPHADYFEVHARGCTLVVMSVRADQALRAMLAPCGRFVPVHCEGRELAGFELTAVDDVLDAVRSEVSWYPPPIQERASRIGRHVFHTDKLGAHLMFRVPQHWQQYVLGGFVAAVRDSDLNGCKFAQVWPHRLVGGRAAE
jgi:hypothetical protein